MTGPADRAVEVLRRRRDGRWTVGSGYLAGGRLVLTAAHNVRSGVDGGVDDVVLVRCLDGSELSAVVLAAGIPPGVLPAVPEALGSAVPLPPALPAAELSASAAAAVPGVLPAVPEALGSAVPLPPALP